MRRVVAAAALMTVAVSGCGPAADRDAGGRGSGTTPDAASTSVTADGVYKVGADVAPGVWTTPYSSCEAFASPTTRTGRDDASGARRTRSVRVEQLRRIVLHDGESFTTRRCGTWHREEPGAPRSPDPATLAGGCEILLQGYELVRHVVWYLRTPTTPQAAAVLQDMLEAPVEAHNEQLAAPSAHLVQDLGDPPRHVTATGDVTPDVTRAVSAIRHACVRS